MKLFLADTSIRQYRRRDGRVAFRLRSYLMIETTTTFRLSAYLRNISGFLKLSAGTLVPLQEFGVSENCIYRRGVMMHDFRAFGIASLNVIKDDVGVLRLDYHISFTGHPSEEPDFIQVHVPLVGRGTAKDRMGIAASTTPARTREPPGAAGA